MAEKEDARGNDESLKLAVAISLLRSKILKNANESSALSPSQSNALLRWKRKAKERKQEILRLREDLKDAQDASHCDLFPESAACKCYFFDNFGEGNPKHHGTGCDSRFSDVLRRRFLRQVRFKERRRKIGSPSSSQQRLSLDLIKEDEAEQLRASVDFLVDLCSSLSPVYDSKFSNLAHQAVDFILVTLKNLLSTGRNHELVEGIVNSLVTRLIRQMCTSLLENGSQYTGTNAQFCVQHLIRKLGSEPYIGQRAILSVCQRLMVLAERLLFCDPFDDDFPEMHDCMFILIQLIEFLVADYLLEWSKAEDFDNVLLEDWVTSIVQARKALELLESRNGLYALYMDRVAGELAKQLGGVSSFLKLKPDIINCLFR
ncbi:protein MULTIPOLAR SPINDLE 1 [Vigna angularis]|uniref:protein MULTIPOLAR SPINDLE 1 n=1 Tax=Phaseolus angularis TaxID=3914 RepID=UPI00080A57EB|nr:protein MULTIPOLAR SPINDLE 1 [Vigna angularis]XP_052735713.1 protein MULTIPOLAR SPINDLE 1 [Vigna angularis]